MKKADKKPKHDAVNHPSHYTDGKYEVIDFIEDKRLDFHMGNAIKYISRAGKKDIASKEQDLQKAVWYLKRRLTLSEPIVIHHGRIVVLDYAVDKDFINNLWHVMIAFGMAMIMVGDDKLVRAQIQCMIMYLNAEINNLKK